VLNPLCKAACGAQYTALQAHHTAPDCSSGTGARCPGRSMRLNRQPEQQGSIRALPRAT